MFFVDSNSPCKNILFLRGPNLAQKPLYLVGTVLNKSDEESVDIINSPTKTVKH